MIYRNVYHVAVKGLLSELRPLSVDELRVLEQQWMECLREKGIDPRVHAFCSKLVELVIEQKLMQ